MMNLEISDKIQLVNVGRLLDRLYANLIESNKLNCKQDADRISEYLNHADRMLESLKEKLDVIKYRELSIKHQNIKQYFQQQVAKTESLTSERQTLLGVYSIQTRRREDAHQAQYLAHTSEEQQKRELEESLLEMIKSMKETALNYSSYLSKDSKVLDTITNKQQLYHSDLKKEIDRLDSIHVRTNFWANLRSLLVIVISIAIFLFMILFIKVFPSKYYITIPYH